jgi:S-formylglutathione hydrolase FrmB
MNYKKKLKQSYFFMAIYIVGTLCSTTANAATVDTIEVYSCLMQKDIKCVVIKPDGYKKKKATFPVVYLLHGYSGDYANWIKKVPTLKNYADDMQLLIVCPDGGFSSWYLDSPIDPTYQYESFVSAELVHHIDNNFKTIKDNRARALTGLSMGGHGGIYVGLKHPQTFGAVGSMSGALDVTYIKTKYQVEKRLGDTATNAANWLSHSTFAMVDTLAPTNQKIIMDCGTEDFVLAFSEDLHKRFLKRKIKHDYILRPGKHDWDYWSNAVAYQLLFFKRFFEEGNKQ